MDCPISEYISKYADEPEHVSASEILNLLLKVDNVYINDELYDLSMITDLINVEEMREAFQSDVKGNNTAVIHVYLKVILELME